VRWNLFSIERGRGSLQEAVKTVDQNISYPAFIAIFKKFSKLFGRRSGSSVAFLRRSEVFIDPNWGE
jgi:hypothetical protein